MTHRSFAGYVFAFLSLNLSVLTTFSVAAEKPQRQAIGRVTSAFGKAHADTAAGVRALDVQSLVYNDERITTDGGELTVLLASRVVLKVDLESAVDVLDDPGQTTLRVERGTVQVFVGQRTPQAGPVCVGDANGCVEATTGVFLVNYDPSRHESYFACEHASIDLHANDMSAHEKLSGDQQAIFRDGKLVSTGALERTRFNETKKSLGRLDQAQASHGAETFRLHSRQLDTEAAIAQLSASGWIDRRVLPTPPTGGGNNNSDGDNSSANTGSGGKNPPTDVSTGKTGAEKTPPPPKDPVATQQPTTPGEDFFNSHDNEDHGHGNGNGKGNGNGHGDGKGSEVVFSAPPVAAPPITAPPVNTPPVAAPPVILPPAAPPPIIDLGLNAIPPVSGTSGPGGSLVSAAPPPAPTPAPPPVQITAPTPVPPIADSTPVTSSTNTQSAPAPTPAPAPAPAPVAAPAPIELAPAPVVTSVAPVTSTTPTAPAPIPVTSVAPAPAPAPTPVIVVDLGLTSSTTVAPAPTVSTVTSPTVAPTGSTLTSPTSVLPTNTLTVTTVTSTGTTSIGTTSVATGTTSTGTGTTTTVLPSPTDAGTTTVTTSTPTVTRTSPKRPKR